ncbi:MAG: glycosyltransferase family 4 protein [Bacteroidota bacterium]
MRVHLYHQYFRHPDEGGALRSYFIGRALVEAGHEVLIISGHNRQKGLQDIDGIPVRYLPVTYANDYSFTKRIWAFLRFAVLAILTARKYPQPDLNYIITTPLTTGLIGLHWKYWRGIPYAFEVGDLWPEVPIQMGMIRNKFLQRLLYGLEKRMYRHAEKLIGLSPAIKDYIEYHCDFQVSAVSIPNMADTDFFAPQPAPQDFDLEHPFVISYIGTMGRANHLNYLLAFAKQCLDEALPVAFHIMGDGARKGLMAQQAQSMANLELHEFGNRDVVGTLIDQSHAVYVSFLDVPILNTGSPNKFFDGLAAGKLILLNFGGWMKKLIDEHECGVYCPPEDPETSVNHLWPFLSSPLLLEEYQTNARKLAEEAFSRKDLTKQLIGYISSSR